MIHIQVIFLILFGRNFISYKSDVSEFGINGRGTGGTASGWQLSVFESDAKYLYLNALNLIFSFSQRIITNIVSPSKTTEPIDANMIFNVVPFVASTIGISVVWTNDGTENDSKDSYMKITVLFTLPANREDFRGRVKFFRFFQLPGM